MQGILVNRQLTSVLLAVLGISILATIYIEEVVEPRTIESTTTTPTLVSSQTCVSLGEAELDKLRTAGVPLAYIDNEWYIFDTFVATSEYEDEDFVACGEPEFIDIIYDKAYGE